MENDQDTKIKQEEEADGEKGAASEPPQDQQTSTASAPTIKQEDAVMETQASTPAEASVKVKAESKVEAAEDGEQTNLPSQVHTGQGPCPSSPLSLVATLVV